MTDGSGVRFHSTTKAWVGKCAARMHTNETAPSTKSASRPSRGLASAQPKTKRSILIVDDNPEKTLALQSVVEELGYSVVVATSAHAGLRELLRQEFALALLDVHMPGIDGFELAALIRSRPAHHDLAIVFMSSLDQTDERLENAYKLGAIDFIALPARRQIIKAKLASLLGLEEKKHVLEIYADESTKRLEQSEERFRLLLENSEDLAIFFIDSAGMVVEWSHAAELCTKWSSEEIIGRDFAVFFAPGDVADRVPIHLLSATRADRRGVSERWMVRKDGNRFWGRMCIVALRGEEHAGFGIILRDASPQKHAEYDLQIKAEVLECMSESVCVFDEQFHIVDANPAASRMFGYGPHELIGSDVRALNGFPPEEGEKRVVELMAHFEHNRRWEGKWQNRRNDGSQFSTYTRISFFRQQGTKYFVCVQQDLTPQQHAEQALQRTAQLEEVVGELEAFSYSISHDLKSPLRTLRGFADVVIQDYGKVLEGTGLDYMHRIRIATERLEALVEDILAVSRLPREALPLGTVDLHRVLNTIVEDSMQFRAPQAQVTIIGPLPHVIGHEPSLRQVFFNLMANAVKFVPSGRSPVITLRAEISGKEATIWVEDNGIGVKPEDFERIFRAFERADATRAFPGSGIGLAIVKRTVERLGGTVGVRSRLGFGSQFWVKLRVAPARL